MPGANGGRERTVTPKELAKRMGVHYSSVYRWILTGRLKALRVGGPRGRYQIREADVQALLQPAEARWA